MTVFKTLAIAAIGLAFGVAGAAAQQKEWKEIRIGTEGAYPPFNNLTADGKLEGFDIDIAQALCDEMKVTCEFVAQEWDGIIPALQAGKFDAIIASMSITPERLKQVDFTRKYYNTPPAIAAPTGSKATLGLRAEDVTLDPKAQDDVAIDGVVNSILPIGSDQFIGMKVAGREFFFRLAKDQACAIGDRVRLAALTNRLHVFDAASGRSLAGG